MRKDFKNALPELVAAGLISAETAGNIEAYYRQKQPDNLHRLYLAFAILGSVLVGAGIILIVAHNWDDLSRPVKTIFAFTPLVLAQIACGYVLLKKFTNTAWREGTSATLFLTVAATVSLVSQIYHIEGNLASFLLTWSWLVLPIMYVMRSSAASLMFWALITYYACLTGYWEYPNQVPVFYFLFLLASLPFYFYLLWKKLHGNFTTLHNIIIPVSLVIVLGTLGHKQEQFLYISYMSLFGLLYIIGKYFLTKGKQLPYNGFTFTGSTGILVLLFTLSFRKMWFEVGFRQFNTLISPEILSAIALTTLALSSLIFGF